MASIQTPSACIHDFQAGIVCPHSRWRLVSSTTSECYLRKRAFPAFGPIISRALYRLACERGTGVIAFLSLERKFVFSAVECPLYTKISLVFVCSCVLLPSPFFMLSSFGFWFLFLSDFVPLRSCLCSFQSWRVLQELQGGSFFLKAKRLCDRLCWAATDDLWAQRYQPVDVGFSAFWSQC